VAPGIPSSWADRSTGPASLVVGARSTPSIGARRLHSTRRAHGQQSPPGRRGCRQFGERTGDALTNGIDRAGKTLENLDWFEVSDIRGHIADQKVAPYEVTMKVGFGTEDRDAPIQFPHRSLGVLRWTRASHGPVPPMRQPRGARR
jgi:hypothetical protein